MEEALKLILEKLESLEKGQVKLTEEVTGLKEGQSELKEDIKDIKFKVDTLYNWVDGIDLAVKNLKKSS